MVVGDDHTPGYFHRAIATAQITAALQADL
jgi:hypothetical protein